MNDVNKFENAGLETEKGDEKIRKTNPFLSRQVIRRNLKEMICAGRI